MLKRLEGELTYKTITKLKQETFANAAAVPTTLSGGQHGHVGLVAPATVYSTLSSIEYITPKKPMQPMFAATPTDAAKVKNWGNSRKHRESTTTITQLIGS
eukprot:3309552-Ditylum_brightwellii.AAC.1